MNPQTEITMLKNLPPALDRLVSIDPDIVGGEPCFTGTRVPLETVVDNLAGGHSIQEILENYRTLRREHVEAVLRWEGDLARQVVGAVIRAS